MTNNFRRQRNALDAFLWSAGNPSILTLHRCRMITDFDANLVIYLPDFSCAQR